MPTAERSTDRLRHSRLPQAACLIATAGLVWAISLQVRVDANVGAPLGPVRTLALAEKADGRAGGLAVGARLILDDRPIDGAAYRLLAMGAAAAGDASTAEELYQLAVRRSPRDPIARAMLVDSSFAGGSIDEGLVHLDALLRTAPELREPLLQRLVRHLGNAEVRAGLVTALANEPPWRYVMDNVLREAAPAPESVEEFLAQLAMEVPLTPDEHSLRVNGLMTMGRPTAARRLWLQALPTSEWALDGSLFDGGFEGAGQTGIFGWSWSAEPGVAIGTQSFGPSEGRQSLEIDFSGRVMRFVGPQQRLVLAPGRYELATDFDDGTESPRRFAWRVRCMPEPTLLEMELVASRVGWNRARATFAVPTGCAMQQLELIHTGRTRMERRISGALRIDNVQLRNVPSQN